jgi:hypothetical protein
MPTNETSKSPQQRTANNAAVSPQHTRNDELQEGDRNGNGEGEGDFEGTNGYPHNSSLSMMKPIETVVHWSEEQLRKTVSLHQTYRLNTPNCYPLQSLLATTLDDVMEAYLAAKGYEKLVDGAWRDLSDVDLEWHILDILGTEQSVLGISPHVRRRN